MEDFVENQLVNIIDIIRKSRKKKGFSHENMAIELNISPSTYNKIERREIKLSLERFLLIKEILGISIEDFFDTSIEKVYNQSFNDNSIFHQEVQNLYQDNKELTNGYIESLKAEIAFLKAVITNK